ncbi:MAG: hypothetical protein GTO63_14160 [Anaerolineae bacterium]|nr:hypothetical protein [Anaerolineae bacterium]NIN95990.1 hypothetical protein [Anaerolineae bacterium]NIQ79022.1 hypothetical protein [Anaerolineae bacterium]
MLQPLLFLVVGAVVGILLLVWVIGMIRKVGGCLIHLALAAAALILFVYLGWLLLQKLFGG